MFLLFIEGSPDSGRLGFDNFEGFFDSLEEAKKAAQPSIDCAEWAYGFCGVACQIVEIVDRDYCIVAEIDYIDGRFVWTDSDEWREWDDRLKGLKEED